MATLNPCVSAATTRPRTPAPQIRPAAQSPARHPLACRQRAAACAAPSHAARLHLRRSVRAAAGDAASQVIDVQAEDNRIPVTVRKEKRREETEET
jgi:hypothetical protein